VSPVNGLYGVRTPSEPVTNPATDVVKAAQSACETEDGKQVAAQVVTVPGDTGP